MKLLLIIQEVLVIFKIVTFLRLTLNTKMQILLTMEILTAIIPGSLIANSKVKKTTVR